MTKAKLNRKTASSSNTGRVKTRNNAVRTTRRKTLTLKPVTKSVTTKPTQSSSQKSVHTESKQARVIAMLRAPGGATIDAMSLATGWQPHSVRGFLAGVVRKKLGLALVSADSDNGRVYRITQTPASAAA